MKIYKEVEKSNSESATPDTLIGKWDKELYQAPLNFYAYKIYIEYYISLDLIHKWTNAYKDIIIYNMK